MNKYYVYEYYNKNNGYIFYVGKGCKDRYKSMRGRNKEFLKYVRDNDVSVRIIKRNITEEEALLLEKNTIQKYRERGFCNCNFDNGGLSFGKGKENSQYGISPRDRMSEEVYNEWREKQKSRKFGSTNPNYNNDTLHKKYENNPLLSLEKQSRPGIQNGMSTPIKMYDSNNNFIKEFSYIRECCDYLIENNYTKSRNVDTIYCSIWKANKHNKKYLNFYFKY